MTLDSSHFHDSLPSGEWGAAGAFPVQRGPRFTLSFMFSVPTEHDKNIRNQDYYTVMTTKRRSENNAAASVAQPKVEGKTVFKLWRDNKIANEYTMTAQEIADKFFESEWFKEWEQDFWTRLDRVWRLFLIAPELPTEQWPKVGLNSVMDDDDVKMMDQFIEDEYHKRPKPEIVPLAYSEEEKKSLNSYIWRVQEITPNEL